MAAVMMAMAAVSGGVIYDVEFGVIPKAVGWFEAADGALDDGVITEDEVVDWMIEMTEVASPPFDYVWRKGKSYEPPCDPPPTYGCDDDLDYLRYVPGDLLQYHATSMWRVDVGADEGANEYFPAAISLVLDDYGEDELNTLIYVVDNLGVFQMLSAGTDASEVIVREVPEADAILLALIGMATMLGRRWGRG